MNVCLLSHRFKNHQHASFAWMHVWHGSIAQGNKKPFGSFRSSPFAIRDFCSYQIHLLPFIPCHGGFQSLRGVFSVCPAVVRLEHSCHPNILTKCFFHVFPLLSWQARPHGHHGRDVRRVHARGLRGDVAARPEPGGAVRDHQPGHAVLAGPLPSPRLHC